LCCHVLNCDQPVWEEYDVIVGQRHYLALDMCKPGVQGDILASPRLADGQQRQFASPLPENSKATIVAAIVDCNYLPSTRG
jgi:hypothetical protein